MEVAMFIGRMLHWLWSSLGLTIVFLLLFHVLKVKNGNQKKMAVFSP